MQPIHSTSHPSGSTRGFATVDPERQGVLMSALRRPSPALRAAGLIPASPRPLATKPRLVPPPKG